MKKNNLKWYEAPKMEIVEMETAVSLLTVSGDDDETVGPPNEGWIEKD